MDSESARRIGVALNEARWLDVQVDRRRFEVLFLFHVLSLPEEGPEPKDPRAVLRCWGASRLAVSLRAGALEDPDAAVVPLRLEDLSKAVRSFGALPIYGWEFVDPPEAYTRRWADQLSLEVRLAEPSRDEHRLYVFQAAEDRCLELCVSFEDLTVTDGKGRPVGLHDFAEGGRRWWGALHAGDPRVQGHGIIPTPETNRWE